MVPASQESDQPRAEVRAIVGAVSDALMDEVRAFLDEFHASVESYAAVGE